MKALGFCAILLCVVDCHARQAWALPCPGGMAESTLAKDVHVVLPLHGDPDYIDHQLKRYMNYPWWWSHCQQGLEENPPPAAVQDNYDKRTYGPNFDIDNSCNENNSSTTTSLTVTMTASGTANRTGSTTTKADVGAELGWPDVGTVSLGVEQSTTVTWNLGVALSGSISATITITPPIGPGIFQRWTPYITWSYRKGADYTYVTGNVDVWCDTHGVWCTANMSGGQTDIYDLDVATTSYPSGGGLYIRSCNTCNCIPQDGWTTMPVAAPAKVQFKQYQNFYNE